MAQITEQQHTDLRDDASPAGGFAGLEWIIDSSESSDAKSPDDGSSDGDSTDGDSSDGDSSDEECSNYYDCQYEQEFTFIPAVCRLQKVLATRIRDKLRPVLQHPFRVCKASLRVPNGIELGGFVIVPEADVGRRILTLRLYTNIDDAASPFATPLQTVRIFAVRGSNPVRYQVLNAPIRIDMEDIEPGHLSDMRELVFTDLSLIRIASQVWNLPTWYHASWDDEDECYAMDDRLEADVRAAEAAEAAEAEPQPQPQGKHA